MLLECLPSIGDLCRHTEKEGGREREGRRELGKRLGGKKQEKEERGR